eukprot:SAG22_NODE_12781_length_429_cov_1.393939_2_plen_26_part_01
MLLSPSDFSDVLLLLLSDQTLRLNCL